MLLAWLRLLGLVVQAAEAICRVIDKLKAYHDKQKERVVK